MKMDEDTIVLWKAQLSGHVPNKDIPLSMVHGAISGAPLHKDLGELIKACQEIGRAYSIAKIECKPSDVEQYPGLPESSPLPTEASPQDQKPLHRTNPAPKNNQEVLEKLPEPKLLTN